MTAAEKEARIATARWQAQSLKTSALLDAIRDAIDVLDGRHPMVGTELLACNLVARQKLDDARKEALK